MAWKRPPRDAAESVSALPPGHHRSTRTRGHDTFPSAAASMRCRRRASGSQEPPRATNRWAASMTGPPATSSVGLERSNLKSSGRFAGCSGARKNLKHRVGLIVRINQHTATLDCDGQKWQVAFELLRSGSCSSRHRMNRCRESPPSPRRGIPGPLHYMQFQRRSVRQPPYAGSDIPSAMPCARAAIGTP